MDVKSGIESSSWTLSHLSANVNATFLSATAERGQARGAFIVKQPQEM